MSYNGISSWGQKETDWTQIDPETKSDFRLTGIAAYTVTEGRTPLRNTDTIVAYVHPEADMDIPEGDSNTLNLIASGDRPPGLNYQDEFGDEIRVVPPDRFYSDIIEGNELYFRKEFQENSDFRENVLNGVSDSFYTRIVDQYGSLFDDPRKLERF